MNRIGFIIAAYAVTWITVIAYAVRLVRVTHRAKEQLAEASRGAGSES